MHARMDAAGSMDAQTASTAPWKTAQDAVSHTAHTHHRFRSKKEQNEDRQPALHTKFLTLLFALTAQPARTDRAVSSHRPRSPFARLHDLRRNLAPTGVSPLAPTGVSLLAPDSYS